MMTQQRCRLIRLYLIASNPFAVRVMNILKNEPSFNKLSNCLAAIGSGDHTHKKG